jgi:hypothetical protein
LAPECGRSAASVLGRTEGAQAKFASHLSGRRDRPHQRELRVWHLLPYCEIVGCYRQPAKCEHIAARFGYSSDLRPSDFIYDHRSALLRSMRCSRNSDRPLINRRLLGSLVGLASIICRFVCGQLFRPCRTRRCRVFTVVLIASPSSTSRRTVHLEPRSTYRSPQVQDGAIAC